MFTLTAHRPHLPVTALTLMLAFAIGAPLAVANPAGQNHAREQLQEIGAWAVPATATATPSQQRSVREQLQEIGAWAVPSTSSAPTTSLASSSEGFQWDVVAVGAGALAALCAAAAAFIASRKRMSPAS